MTTRTLKIEYSAITDEKNLTVLYARLSKDDGKAGDSDSIQNQQMMLEKYAEEQHFYPYVFLYDDGVSGTTFNRPAFQQAIDLVNRGQVKNFVVKDLSRFGRDYLKVGAFTEVAFPEKGVRFIAINDNVDSENQDDNSLAPFRNLFNEWYARDCSKKIKAVKHAKGNAGIPISANLPYGYLKGKNYKVDHEWVVDRAAAVIMQRIFHEYASGKSMTAIAKELKAEKILTPAAHKLSIGVKSSKMTHDPIDWNSQIVRQVLGHREYCGHTVNFKTYKASYKTKTYEFNPLEKQKIFKDTHEAIIDEELFELVQEKRGTYRPRMTHTKSVGLFSDLLFCMDCGSIHQYYQRDVIPNYYCSGHAKRIKICDDRHGINEKFLTEYVLKDIRRMTEQVMDCEDELVAFVEKKRSSEQNRKIELAKKELQKSKQRSEQLDSFIQRLYEDNVTGKVSDERFAKMSASYEQEQKELSQKIVQLETQLYQQEQTSSDIARFIQTVRQYLNPETLEPDMVRALIEKIEIGKKVNRRGNYYDYQKIRIIYRFVGELTDDGN